MKRWLTILVLVCAVMVHAQSVTLAWNASPSPEVTGYRVYYGTNSRSYAVVTNAGMVLTQTVVLPHLGRWFFAATA
ncbi:MAG: fibronectin type III, partial [Verrucomicrobia bacterium]|nr:fibronectin type III [Verrucomicrobiota bacterium]